MKDKERANLAARAKRSGQTIALFAVVFLACLSYILLKALGIVHIGARDFSLTSLNRDTEYAIFLLVSFVLAESYLLFRYTRLRKRLKELDDLRCHVAEGNSDRQALQDDVASNIVRSRDLLKFWEAVDDGEECDRIAEGHRLRLESLNELRAMLDDAGELAEDEVKAYSRLLAEILPDGDGEREACGMTGTSN